MANNWVDDPDFTDVATPVAANKGTAISKELKGNWVDDPDFAQSVVAEVPAPEGFIAKATQFIKGVMPQEKSVADLASEQLPFGQKTSLEAATTPNIIDRARDIDIENRYQQASQPAAPETYDPSQHAVQENFARANQERVINEQIRASAEAARSAELSQTLRGESAVTQEQRIARRLPAIDEVRGEGYSTNIYDNINALLGTGLIAGGAGAIGGAIRGQDISQADTWLEQAAQHAIDFSNDYLERARFENISPTISSAGQSVGYSAATMAPMAIPYIGQVLSFGMMYRGAQNQFMNQMRKAYEGKYGKVSDEAWSKKSKSFDDELRNYGLWEAIPEYASDRLFLGILGKTFGTKAVGGLTKKFGAYYGLQFANESPSEAATNLGQEIQAYDAQKKLGIPTEGRRPNYAIRDFIESYKKVAPSVALSTLILGGAGGAIASAMRDNKAVKAAIDTGSPKIIDSIQRVAPRAAAIISELKAKAAEVEKPTAMSEAFAKVKVNRRTKAESVSLNKRTKNQAGYFGDVTLEELAESLGTEVAPAGKEPVSQIPKEVEHKTTVESVVKEAKEHLKKLQQQKQPNKGALIKAEKAMSVAKAIDKDLGGVKRGDEVNLKITGNTADIYGIYAAKPGTKLYERTVHDLASKAVKTINVHLQSADSQGALKDLVDRGILENPRNIKGSQYPGAGYPSTFDIADNKLNKPKLGTKMPEVGTLKQEEAPFESRAETQKKIKERLTELSKKEKLTPEEVQEVIKIASDEIRAVDETLARTKPLVETKEAKPKEPAKQPEIDESSFQKQREALAKKTKPISKPGKEIDASDIRREANKIYSGVTGSKLDLLADESIVAKEPMTGPEVVRGRREESTTAVLPEGESWIVRDLKQKVADAEKLLAQHPDNKARKIQVERAKKALSDQIGKPFDYQTDMLEETKHLTKVAHQKGFKNVDEFAKASPEEFAETTKQWRKQHPVPQLRMPDKLEQAEAEYLARTGGVGVSPKEITTNPSVGRLTALLRKTENHSLRGIMDEAGNIHLWDATKATHESGAKSAGVAYDIEKRVYIGMEDGKPLFGNYGNYVNDSTPVYLRRYMTDAVLFYAPGHGIVTGAELLKINAQNNLQVEQPEEEYDAGTKTLIIQHNLSSENLLHADRMGGIPVPSLAITKAKAPMENFGEITLLGGVDMADPKGYAKTKVFGADIYSPRYPEISYKLDKNALKKLNAELSPFRKEGEREIYGGEINKVDDLTQTNAFRALMLSKTGKKDIWDLRSGDMDAEASKMLADVGAEEKLFRGFTYSGNRIYRPHTLENVVKILKQGLRGGENFNYGVGSIRSAFTPQFRSVKQIKQAENRLLGDKEFEAIKEEMNNELIALADEFTSYHAIGNQFGFLDTMSSTLYDAAKMGLPRAFKENGFEEVPQEKLKLAADFLNKLRNLPTEYFEAKILRAVDLSEFKGAVVPAGTKQEVLDALKRRGITNIKEYDSNKVGDRAVQIKALAEETGTLFQKEEEYGTREPAPTFYSQLAKQIDATPERIFQTGKQVSDWLDSNAAKLGIKKDEIEATGIKDWLQLQGKVSKSDVQNFLDQNGVQVQEVMLGDSKTEKQPVSFAEAQRLLREEGDKWDITNQYGGRIRADRVDTMSENQQYFVRPEEGKTKFASYQLPGGESYKELLLTLPVDLKGQYDKIAKEEFGRPYDELSTIQKTHVYGMAKGRTEENGIGTFKSAHYDQPNILAHIRFNERTDAEGKRVLFIEEIQSDWGQKGKKAGFKNKKVYVVVSTGLGNYITTFQTRSQAEEFLKKYDGVIREEDAQEGDRGVPSAPFVTDTKSWTALALKRMIRYAAENGFDRVAWTTGEQQAARYDLSKQVGSVVYRPANKTLRAYSPTGERLIHETVEPEKVQDYIGKEAAQKLLNAPVDSFGEQELKSDDLKVGGEGMKGYYDQIVPQVANDILKKIGGGKVEAVGISTGKEEYALRNKETGNDIGGGYTLKQAQEQVAKKPEWEYYKVSGGEEKQQGFIITPEMRSKVMAEGMALFQKEEPYQPKPSEQITKEEHEVLERKKEQEQKELEEQAKHDALMQKEDKYEADKKDQAEPDIYEGLPVRPGTTEQQKQLGRDAYRDILSAYARRAGASVLGSRIAKDFQEQGGTALHGQVAETPEDFAVLAQVLRDPRWEKVRFFYAQDSKIVGHDAFSTQNPGQAGFVKKHPNETQADAHHRMLVSLRRNMNAVKANGFWIVHNHPAGKADPSIDDIRATQYLARMIPGFKGHIVIDHNEYAHITSSGDYKVFMKQMPDTIGQEAEIPHNLLGSKIKISQDVIAIAKQLERKEGWFTLIGRSGATEVTALAEFPSSLLKAGAVRELRLHATMKRFAKQTGSTNIVAVAGDRADLAPLEHLVNQGFMLDAVDANGYSARDYVTKAPTAVQAREALFGRSKVMSVDATEEEYNTTVKPAVEESTQTLRQRGTSAIAKTKEFINKMAPLGNLPNRAEYLKTRYLTQGRIAEVNEGVKELYEAFKDAGDESPNIYQYLTTKDESPLIIKDETLRATAIQAKQMMIDTGAELVKRGLLDEQAYEANKGAYLPKVYLKYLLEEQDILALGTGKRPSPMGWAKPRKNIPEDVRRIIYGEITEPGYLASKGFGVQMRDVALMDWFAEISQSQDWILPESIIQWNGRRVTPFYLKAEAGRIRKQSLYYTEQDHADAVKTANAMEEAADRALGDFSGVPEGWGQMPNTPRYGAMRGLVVRKEIYDDIVGVTNINTGDTSVAEKILGNGGLATRATQLWKWAKVAGNPPAQVRNFLSNGILLHLSGVSFHMVPTRIAQSIHDIRTDGKYWQVAKKYGVTESTFAANELFRIDRELLDLEARHAGKLSWSTLKNIVGRTIDFTGDIYQASEALFKTAKIIDEMKKGKSESDAAIEAQKWMFDYSLVSPSVRYLRNAPIGAPFLTFALKALPRMLEVAITHPLRFAPYAAIPFAMTSLLASMTGVDNDDVDKLKKALPQWLQDRGNVYILPYKDEQGRWQAMDFGYFLPWSMWQSLGTELAQGDIDKAVMASGMFGGPVVDMVAALKTNIDPFTQKKIVNDYDPPATQVASIMGYLYRMAAPTWLTDIGFAGHMYRAMNGYVDKYGTPKSSVGQAALRIGGFNIYPVNPEMTRAENLRRMKFEIEEVKKRRSILLKDRNLTTEERQEIAKEYAEMMKRRVDQMQKYANESEVHPRLR